MACAELVGPECCIVCVFSESQFGLCYQALGQKTESCAENSKKRNKAKAKVFFYYEPLS